MYLLGMTIFWRAAAVRCDVVLWLGEEKETFPAIYILGGERARAGGR
jgi:hypothetical protein